MNQVMYVVHLSVLRAQKSLHMTPRALYGDCVGAYTLVNEANGVANGAVRVTFPVEIPVRYPTVTDGCSAGFDPSIYKGHLSVSGSVRNGNEKRFTRAQHREHPLPLNRVAPIFFSAEMKPNVYLFDKINVH